MRLKQKVRQIPQIIHWAPSGPEFWEPYVRQIGRQIGRQSRSFCRSKCRFRAKHAAKHAAEPFILPFKMDLLQIPGKTSGGAESLT